MDQLLRHPLLRPLLSHPILRPLRVKYSISKHPAGRLIYSLFKGHDIVVFDIGAHIGEATETYQKWFPNAVFHLFEADPEVAAMCSERTKGWNNILLHTFACGDENTTAAFYPTAHQQQASGSLYAGASGSLLKPSGHQELFPHIKFREKIEVPVKRLDDWMQAHGVPAPKFIHMDVQGAELLVLRGLGSKINEVEAIWLEVERKELYENQPLEDDVMQFFVGLGWTKVVDTVGDIAGDQLWLSPKAYERGKSMRLC